LYGAYDGLGMILWILNDMMDFEDEELVGESYIVV